MGQNQAKPDTKVRLRYRLLGVFFCFVFLFFQPENEACAEEFPSSLIAVATALSDRLWTERRGRQPPSKGKFMAVMRGRAVGRVSLNCRLKVSFVRWACVFLSRACVSECVAALCSEDIHAVRSPGYDGFRCCVGEQV